MMMNVSCDALGYYGVPNPSREELDGILAAISAEAKDSGLDERFLLAIMVSFRNCFMLSVSDADECAVDARVQRLCASKVHIFTRRFDQESWVDASEFNTSKVSDRVRILTMFLAIDAQRHWQLQRRRSHGGSLPRRRNQTNDPRWYIWYRSRRRLEASVSHPPALCKTDAQS